MIFDRILQVLTDVNHVIEVVNSFQYGSVIVNNGMGNDGIEVVTRQQPQEVWFRIPSGDGMAVCHGDVSKVGYEITPTGFILYPEVNANKLQIDWYALFPLS